MSVSSCKGFFSSTGIGIETLKKCTFNQAREYKSFKKGNQPSHVCRPIYARIFLKILVNQLMLRVFCLLPPYLPPIRSLGCHHPSPFHLYFSPIVLFYIFPPFASLPVPHAATSSKPNDILEGYRYVLATLGWITYKQAPEDHTTYKCVLHISRLKIQTYHDFALECSKNL